MRNYAVRLSKKTFGASQTLINSTVQSQIKICLIVLVIYVDL